MSENLPSLFNEEFIDTFNDVFVQLLNNDPEAYGFILSQPNSILLLEDKIIQQLNYPTDPHSLSIASLAILQMVSHYNHELSDYFSQAPQVLYQFLQKYFNIFTTLTMKDISEQIYNQLMDDSIISFLEKFNTNYRNSFFEYFTSFLVPLLATNPSYKAYQVVLLFLLRFFSISWVLNMESVPMLMECIRTLLPQILPDPSTDFFAFINSDSVKLLIVFCQNSNSAFFNDDFLQYVSPPILQFIPACLGAISQSISTQTFSQIQFDLLLSISEIYFNIFNRIDQLDRSKPRTFQAQFNFFSNNKHIIAYSEIFYQLLSDIHFIDSAYPLYLNFIKTLKHLVSFADFAEAPLLSNEEIIRILLIIVRFIALTPNDIEEFESAPILSYNSAFGDLTTSVEEKTIRIYALEIISLFFLKKPEILVPFLIECFKNNDIISNPFYVEACFRIINLHLNDLLSKILEHSKQLSFTSLGNDTSFERPSVSTIPSLSDFQNKNKTVHNYQENETTLVQLLQTYAPIIQSYTFSEPILAPHQISPFLSLVHLTRIIPNDRQECRAICERVFQILAAFSGNIQDTQYIKQILAIGPNIPFTIGCNALKILLANSSITIDEIPPPIFISLFLNVNNCCDETCGILINYLCSNASKESLSQLFHSQILEILIQKIIEDFQTEVFNEGNDNLHDAKLDYQYMYILATYVKYSPWNANFFNPILEIAFKAITFSSELIGSSGSYLLFQFFVNHYTIISQQPYEVPQKLFGYLENIYEVDVDVEQSEYSLDVYRQLALHSPQIIFALPNLFPLVLMLFQRYSYTYERHDPEVHDTESIINFIQRLRNNDIELQRSMSTYYCEDYWLAGETLIRILSTNCLNFPVFFDPETTPFYLKIVQFLNAIHQDDVQSQLIVQCINDPEHFQELNNVEPPEQVQIDPEIIENVHNLRQGIIAEALQNIQGIRPILADLFNGEDEDEYKFAITKLILSWEILFCLGVPDLDCGFFLLGQNQLPINDRIRLLYLTELMGNPELILPVFQSIQEYKTNNCPQEIYFIHNDVQYLLPYFFPDLDIQSIENTEAQNE